MGASTRPLPERGTAQERGTAREVFGAFLRLGLTSFGGPIAHLGYLRTEFVDRRQWVDAPHFAQLLALSQFLPGPASSQIGFALGLGRAGWTGAVAAFAGFTLPSAVLLLLLARAGDALRTPTGRAVTHGLALVAVAVVAHGVLRMARQLTPDWTRRLIAAAAAIGVVAAPRASAQVLVILAGAAAGAILCRTEHLAPTPALAPRHGVAAAWPLLALFGIGLALALLPIHPAPSLAAIAAAFYRAGALVFGGGHVVLPLLQETMVGSGWTDASSFLAGYGAAQAIPGPMFSLAAFLGTLPHTGSPAVLGGLVALGAVFLPGFLLVGAVLPLWARLQAREGARRSMMGVNAAVVGLLAAALYDPLWTKAIAGGVDIAIAAAGLLALLRWERATPLVVIGCVAASIVLGRMT